MWCGLLSVFMAKGFPVSSTLTPGGRSCCVPHLAERAAPVEARLLGFFLNTPYPRLLGTDGTCLEHVSLATLMERRVLPSHQIYVGHPHFKHVRGRKLWSVQRG